MNIKLTISAERVDSSPELVGLDRLYQHLIQEAGRFLTGENDRAFISEESMGFKRNEYVSGESIVTTPYNG